MKIIADIKITKLMERRILKYITKNGSSVFDIRHRNIISMTGVPQFGDSHEMQGLTDKEIVTAMRIPKKETYFVRIINKAENKSYRIDESGITELYSKNPKSYLWSDFWLIKYNPQYFFMRLNDGESYFVIPRKALTAEGNNELMIFLENSYRDSMGRKLEKL